MLNAQNVGKTSFLTNQGLRLDNNVYTQLH